MFTVITRKDNKKEELINVQRIIKIVPNKSKTQYNIYFAKDNNIPISVEEYERLVKDILPINMVSGII